MIIGLTGGIATGKSTVSSLLHHKGALIIDADVIAREVMLPGHPVLAEVVKHFGQAILLPDGQLNRKMLGEIIFNQPGEREKLNQITHPAIRQEMWDRMHFQSKECPSCLIVVDIPLLYESGLQTMFEQVLVVYTPRSVQLQRLMERNQLTLEEAESRLHAQMDIEEKKQLANLIIDNSGTLSETGHQVDQLWQDLRLL
ncbi:dephospho-CoA kinase [Paenibacillus pini]|uniref:Dephospho-CoA kinase n=1 Tax=Paenibacillus pini JCM 16418 TaxID=1236976 RepID=W7YD01_9BACL|nr:dephospho-CoA kinase [Paenibacillus pini]GAF06342.1 dephospho-CoA kinase [Paenibacillus pini JCM 16418]